MSENRGDGLDMVNITLQLFALHLSGLTHSSSMVYLESAFIKYHTVHTVIGLSLARNEALSRSSFNLIILNFVLEERMHTNKSREKTQPQASSLFTPFVTPPKIIPERPASTSVQDICVYFETEIRQTISFKGKDYVLSDVADYSYGYKKADTRSGYLVAVEAKRHYHLSLAYGLLLAYMGL